MNQIFETEKKYLDYIKKVIEFEIKKCQDFEKKMIKDSTSLSFEDRLRGTHFNLNAQLLQNGERKFKLEKSKSCPYFGRIDYQDSNKNVSSIYIGRSAVTHDNNQVVYDWRSPICSLYYDSEVGPVSYNSLSGVEKGFLLLKRQITIKDGVLINAVDTNLVSEDELLIPYLNVNADNAMKTIIASIQKEQNNIIRSRDIDLIVQGVAGSGKTSVALHRIAYLLYMQQMKSKSDDFLIIGPNDYFLNYISTVLPDLETDPVEQKTLLRLMNDYIGTTLKIQEEKLSGDFEQQCTQKKIAAFKGSFEYRNLLNDFAQSFINENVSSIHDFVIDGKTVFSAEDIQRKMNELGESCIDLSKTHKYFKMLFKNKKESIYDRLNDEYRKKYISLPISDPSREKYVQKSIELNNLIKKQGDKLLDKYFKSITVSCVSLYMFFINSLNTLESSLTNKEVQLLQLNVLKSLKKKQILYEDISALMYLNYLLTNKTLDYRNIVIDEAQDYSLLAYYTFRKIFKNATFNIYGDLAQSIYSYRSISSWAELNELVFDNKCNLQELNKSYRTTIEITETANNVLNELGLHVAHPVIRHGNAVKYINTINQPDAKINAIYNWVNSGYQTIAVICKDEAEAKKVYIELSKKGISARYISQKDTQYSGGIFVMTVMSSKGLEFDCAIINNASSNIYDINNDVDMHLLYVATTRALHEQIIMYDGEIVKPFKNEIKQSQAFSRKLLN